MNRMQKMIGSTLLGVTVIGGAGSLGAGLASAAPNQPSSPTTNAHQPDRAAAKPNPKPAPNQAPQRAKPQANGQNPDWRPGPVFHQGAWRTPIWDANKKHWGFWLGPVWVPVG
ncbi:putative protein OS=Tsukamurella paurometabola (strain ATCC 8368 / DSM / CCUG 35730 /CIP 100753 / JCM 10117 / KCTC 9821 / NBRC 16120 / NCIMB 702349/ NCTC 13040) OX=521096 GN=Tpau_2551 PE=4 SV=1 [Tsukamurella paurometabola]|uniref:Uncharacterized protein n=1 Tax=Tsukamurella paurometabola (strain ATCC 8368 / DSM 20162 / CCUG 35730 / CIP 100753 / JCM 10117 / KCTC 9821 / NBRC 16120 / NCIMB 702349 / NCTC 13040) TaxID=521096 RepID=D5URU9_TSUPD|nr:hypothetical protein [Tsukamurella paurometabola]ADG79154.1 conserved hypothetical protein [Tsukamurella paurometabola DSM 20162]SUP34310.1 Uncharacterised protein [Tsukamurella paurometabola]